MKPRPKSVSSKNIFLNFFGVFNPRVGVTGSKVRGSNSCISSNPNHNPNPNPKPNPIPF